MKNIDTMSGQKICFLLIIIKLLCVKAEIGCPPEEDIRPCICSNSPYPIIQCKNIQDGNVLKEVFSMSKGYSYREVHIIFSILKYLPKELFENTGVSELYIKDSTLYALFDSPPENLHLLRKLHLENTNIIELSHWELIETLTHLKILTIYQNHIEGIDSSVTKYISKDITQFTLYGTGTKYVKPGALVELKNLEKFAVDKCKLKEISRDIFAIPSGIKHLYFNDNDLKAIPDNMFTDMPNLKTVGLRDNILTSVSAAAFGGNARRLDWLFLEGNPLKCNCDFRWIVDNKPDYLSGSCVTPIRVHDKPLKDLTEKDFKC